MLCSVSVTQLSVYMYQYTIALVMMFDRVVESTINTTTAHTLSAAVYCKCNGRNYLV